MDTISQIQSYTIALADLFRLSLEQVRGTQLSPEEAAALAALANTSGTQNSTNAAWDVATNDTLTSARDIFKRIAEVDAIMASLPASYASESEQFQEMSRLVETLKAAETRLEAAEAAAVQTQTDLRGLVKQVSEQEVPVDVYDGAANADTAREARGGQT